MAETFRLLGRVDMELRDLLGAGHARFLTLANTRKFDSVLSEVARGKLYCGIAITEPGVGSDLSGLQTTATLDGLGNYVLNGTKQFVSRITEASHFIVLAATKVAKQESRISAFLLPKDTANLTIEVMAPSGLERVSWGKITLREALIPAAARIGGEGRAIALFQQHFSYWRTMMAAAAVGCAEAALDSTVELLQNRHSFGGPIGRFTHLQLGLAKNVAQLRMAWLLVEDVARMMDAKGMNRRPWPVYDAAMVKAEAVEIAIAATEWSMNALGGASYNVAEDVNKRYRDLLGMRFADGTTDVLRGQVARSVLGERLYELSLNRKTGEKLSDDAHRRYW